MTRLEIPRPSISSIPICVTIAGSDSGGGAGIQADLKTFSALGCYGASIVTAITAQNTKAVTAVHDIPADVVTAQIEAVFSDLSVYTVKIGMLSVPETINAVAAGLAGFAQPIVLDPVMVAKSGDRLLSMEAISTLREKLLPRATLLTPNLPEAACLLECDVAQDVDEAVEQGRALLALGAGAVLMKGGHSEASECVDLLIRDGLPPFRLTAPRIATRNTHGTGCTLSSAIAAGLAKGLSLEDAFTAAHAYLQGAIRAAGQLNVGSGNGPVHHFHAMWNLGVEP
ncbi:bifunctional hydroxymethylpyrimidine kinase/phosphomethylpyrimidine kinase [Phyllobacterium leguminum]|uniref:hydroxymethylpyrimidine kinase n=1 Tax=Phyllobacterium leguminum TaxID=314237 RepID=A0A318T5Q5_9HYPH|nr:bifunctional hydroxymethylpyrimidine kinase/phosphomethylpyrimidine kinase [Phyllobacterium leguminum]PYE87602.1 hydroxymethylpyrimidine kinase /phosphomethylpyrimidine kinase [Phyllobacterium leguminum]